MRLLSESLKFKSILFILTTELYLKIWGFACLPAGDAVALFLKNLKPQASKYLVNETR
jgi:hypothetical protein